MSVDAVVYYRVSNATISVANVENAHHSTRLLAQTTLRNMLGTKNLHEILGDRSVAPGGWRTARRHTGPVSGVSEGWRPSEAARGTERSWETSLSECRRNAEYSDPAAFPMIASHTGEFIYPNGMSLGGHTVS